MTIRLKKSLWFLVFTFGFSWGLAMLVFWIWPGEAAKKAILPLSLAYMFIPMLAAILVQKGMFRDPIQKPLGISFTLNAWFGIAILLPVVVALLAFGCSLLLPGVELSLNLEGMYARFQGVLAPEQIEQIKTQTEKLVLHPFWLNLIQGVLAGVTINAVAGFGEELGWRGLLQKELCVMGFWRSSLIIGFFWGIWHAPLILKGHNYPEHPVAGIFYMVYFTMLYAPLFAYVRARSRSVIASAMMHGTLNGTAGLAILLIKGGTDLSVGVTGVAGFMALLVVNAGVWAYDTWLTKDPLIPHYKKQFQES